jgi:hypothetical protein
MISRGATLQNVLRHRSGAKNGNAHFVLLVLSSKRKLHRDHQLLGQPECFL